MWGYVIDTLHKSMNKKDEKYIEQLDVWKVSNLKNYHLDQQFC